MVLEKTLESPSDCKEIQPVDPKEISPERSSEELMLNLKLQSFGHLMRRIDSLEKTLRLGKIEGRRRRGRHKMRWLDGITDSMDTRLRILRDFGDGQESLGAAVSGVAKSWTGLSNWTELSPYWVTVVGRSGLSFWWIRKGLDGLYLSGLLHSV